MSDRQERIDGAITEDELSAFEQFCNKAIHPGLHPSEVIMLANWPSRKQENSDDA